MRTRLARVLAGQQQIVLQHTTRQEGQKHARKQTQASKTHISQILVEFVERLHVLLAQIDYQTAQIVLDARWS